MPNATHIKYLSHDFKTASRFSLDGSKIKPMLYTVAEEKQKWKKTAGNSQIRNMLKQDDFEIKQWSVESEKWKGKKMMLIVLGLS